LFYKHFLLYWLKLSSQPITNIKTCTCIFCGSLRTKKCSSNHCIRSKCNDMRSLPACQHVCISMPPSSHPAYTGITCHQRVVDTVMRSFNTVSCLVALCKLCCVRSFVLKDAKL